PESGRHLGEVAPGAGDAEVAVASDLAERGLVEAALDRAPVAVGLVADDVALALDRDRRAVRGPDARGEERHAEVRGVPERGAEAAAVVLAVGDDEEGAGALCGRLTLHVEGLERDAERLAEVGALRRDKGGLGGVEEEADGAEVGREGTLQECLAGEDDEAGAAAAELGEEALDLVLRTGEPARSDILGLHRLRDVEGDEHVEAVLLDLAEVGSVARPGEGDGGEEDGAGEEGGLPATAPREALRVHIALQPGEPAERLAPLRGGPPEERGGRRHGGEREQPRWIGPGHGTRRRRVVERRTSSRRRKKAGQRKAA